MYNNDKLSVPVVGEQKFPKRGDPVLIMALSFTFWSLLDFVYVHVIFVRYSHKQPFPFFSNSVHLVFTTESCLFFYTSLNVDSLIGSKLPKIESTCLTTIIGLEI